ncbi:unnamed protein product, partial [Didymodactylos carnosus]
AKRTGDERLRVESTRIRNVVRSELKQFRQSQLVKQLAERHKPGRDSMIFWNRTKKQFRICSSSLRGFLLLSGEMVKSKMADLAADYYEKLFEEPVVYRPHPYVDIPYDVYEDSQRQIPLVTYPEILKVLKWKKKKRSCDIHGLSPFILGKMPENYWHLMVDLYNHSFRTCQMQSKLKRQGIPIPYVNWIHTWLIKRRAVIEIAGVKSRWFEIMRGGPQGSSFTATLFITYHADMEYFIPEAMSFLFADDLAAVLAGQIGIKFTQQCIDLEKRLHIFFEQLEFYAVLTVQRINCIKTKGMFSARAINYPNPMPDIR